MENADLLIKAISAGMAASQNAGDSALENDYADLKALIKLRFRDMKGEMILNGFEEEPNVWKKPLRSELIKTDADKDERIIKAARHLLGQAKIEHDDSSVCPNIDEDSQTFGDKKGNQREITIGRDADGNTMVAGDNNQIADNINSAIQVEKIERFEQHHHYPPSPEDAYALRNSHNKILPKLRDVGTKELDEINAITYGDPMELAKYYVEPNCQEVNPADDHEERFMHAREPVMKKIDEFFMAKVCQAGDNQLFILSDAGMGKTALLTMLKIMHLTAFWPSGKNCVLKKLSEKTLEQIAEISGNAKIILLLDSLDEDPTAFGRVHERLMEILDATKHFYRLIITCRTQFFPDVHKDPFKRPGVAVIGGYRCPVKYLSFFDDEMVMKYLSNRFPKKFGLFTDTKKIREARKVIEKMGSLRCRPMLLAHIEDLMKSPLLEKGDSEYHVYDALVQNWLIREKTKHKEISEKVLSDACMILAAFLQIRNSREISEQDLNWLIAKISKARPIIDIDFKGRSLLNRNSEGDYRFSHYSIQEFLVAKLLLSDKPIYNPNQPIHLTDFIFRMLRMSKKVPNFMNLLDFRGLILSNADLRGVKLPGANLKGLDLSGSDMRDADLSDADLSNANLCKANLIGANLNGANRCGTQDEGAKYFDEIVNAFGMKFIKISPGEFMRENSHKVTLTQSFYMQTTQVTQGQWKALMGNNPSKFEGCEDCPVENVSWDEVQKFIKKLNQREGGDRYRLPTEAEWEYACRVGSMTAYCFGDDESRLGEYAWYSGNSDGKTHPVGQLKPNAWGLYDMHGNVWEWCSDWYEDYPSRSVTAPKGPDKGSGRVFRGGGWYDVARNCRSAYRDSAPPADRYSDLGFRLLRDAP